MTPIYALLCVLLRALNMCFYIISFTLFFYKYHPTLSIYNNGYLPKLDGDASLGAYPKFGVWFDE